MAYVAILLVIVTSAAAAEVLRRSRCPGWPVVGGVLVGLLLGPTVLEKVRAQEYDRLFEGVAQTRITLNEMLHEQDREHAVARETGASPEALESLIQRHATARQPLEAAVQTARQHHQRPLHTTVAVLVALLLLLAGTHSVRAGPSPALAGAVSIGLWAALLPGGLTFLALHFIWDQHVLTAMIAASALAIGPWALTDIDRSAADDAEQGGARLVQAGGRVASFVALLVLLIGTWRQHGSGPIVTIIPVLIFPASWLLPRMRVIRIRRLVDHVLLPALAGFVAVTIDLYDHTSIWLIVLVALLSGDGRWLGALFGALTLGGRRGLRTMRLVLGAMACGPTQLAFAAVLAWGELVEPIVIPALLAGVLLIETTASARRGVAAHLTEAEEQIDELTGGE